MGMEDRCSCLVDRLSLSSVLDFSWEGDCTEDEFEGPVLVERDIMIYAYCSLNPSKNLNTAILDRRTFLEKTS